MKRTPARARQRTWATIAVALGGAALGAAALVMLSAGKPENTTTTDPPAGPASAASASTAAEPDQCVTCHAPIVDAYRGHGMSRSVGRPDAITPGTVANPASGVRYTINTIGGNPSLTASMPDGGTRRQRIVGRIGAGIFDASWVGTEIDSAGRTDTGRLFFAPVETITGSGLRLSPFELHERSPGLDMPLTATA